MNNSVYGKICENLRKRVDVRLVTDQNKLPKLASKPTYVNSKICTEDLVTVHKIKETLKLDGPAYVGMCILDLSKTLMYDFHYNYIKKRYNNKAKLLFIDTDSLCYEIETRIFMRSYGRIEIYLTTVIIQKTAKFLIQQIKKLSVNLKMKQLACLLWNLLVLEVRCILM